MEESEGHGPEIRKQDVDPSPRNFLHSQVSDWTCKSGTHSILLPDLQTFLTQVAPGGLANR